MAMQRMFVVRSRLCFICVSLSALCVTLVVLTAWNQFPFLPASSRGELQPVSAMSALTHYTSENSGVTSQMLSRVLQNLEQFSFKLDGFPMEENLECVHAKDKQQPPKELLVEPQRWQSVKTLAASSFVFSAFYDARWNPPVIVVIGMASEYTVDQSGQRQRYCRMWFKEERQPLTVSAFFQFIPETHARKYASVFYTCPFTGRREPPYAVSLISSCSDIAENLLKVIDSRPKAASSSMTSSQRQYTVCMALLHSNYSEYARLIETIELNRSFGAQKFVIYVMSSSADVQLVLDYYRHVGIVDVIPWSSLPVTSWPEFPERKDAAIDVHYYGQVAALNDCLYRNLFNSKYIIFTDADEVAVPLDAASTAGGTWSTMIEDATRAWLTNQQLQPDAGTQFPGVFMLRNAFFKRKHDHANSGGVSRANIWKWILENTEPNIDCRPPLERENYVYPFDERSKYFVWSQAAVMIGIHFPWKVMNSVKTVYVDEQRGLLHHYRVWQESEHLSTEYVVDTTLDRICADISRRVSSRRREVLEFYLTFSVQV